MKELSIEEKAKRYDVAIKRLEDIKTGKCQKTFMYTEGLFDYIFPELKDEDERLWLIKFIQEEIDCLFYDIRDNDDRTKLGNLRRSLSWLEKQGEQKPAWSEEDEKKTNYLIALLQNSTMHNSALRMVNEEIENWLKSLKERYTWKPSEEQMYALSVLNVTGDISYAEQGQELINLYNDLKKLTEE